MAGPQTDRFTFVHAADLHLDTPFLGVHAESPAVAIALRDASIQAFEAIVDLTLEREAAFLLVAGDVYDGPERGLRAQLAFRAGLGRLSEAGIPSFVVHGNHDPVTTGWSAIGNWPDLVTVFGCEEAEVVPVVRNGEQIATVQGISYATRATTENLSRRLHRPPGDGLHIGLLHCNLEGAEPGHANYSPCSTEDLRATGLDYLALGHVHQRRVIAPQSPGDGPFIVYPGNSQARSPRPSELGPKGAVVGHVEGGVVTTVEFVACDRVRFATEPVEIDALDDLGELEDRLAELERNVLAEAGGRSVLLRARLIGRGPIHGDLSRPGVVEGLLTHRREEASHADAFCWWDRIVDETAATIDRDEIRGRGDFTADLLAIAEELERDPESLAAFAQAIIDEAPRAFVARLQSLVEDERRLVTLASRATNAAIAGLAEEPQ